MHAPSTKGEPRGGGVQTPPQKRESRKRLFFACLGVFGVFGVFGVVENEPLRARAAALPLQVLRRQKHLLLLSRETTQRVHGVRRRQRCCEHGWSRSHSARKAVGVAFASAGGGATIAGSAAAGASASTCGTVACKECGGGSLALQVASTAGSAACATCKCCWVNLLENLRVT